MNISVKKLLDKIEEELMEAKRLDSEAKVRERIYAIKTLCELILEESTPTKNAVVTSVPSPPSQTVMQPVNLAKHSRLKEDDGANGDSLFDF